MKDNAVLLASCSSPVLTLFSSYYPLGLSYLSEEMSHNVCQRFSFHNPLSTPIAPYPHPQALSWPPDKPTFQADSLCPLLAAQNAVSAWGLPTAQPLPSLYLLVLPAKSFISWMPSLELPLPLLSPWSENTRWKQLELKICLSRTEGRAGRIASLEKQKKCHLVVQDTFFTKNVSQASKNVCVLSHDEFAGNPLKGPNVMGLTYMYLFLVKGWKTFYVSILNWAKKLNK